MQLSNLILFNKPYGVLSQFTDRSQDRKTLSDFITLKGFYPAGRLDMDSEGLLILTNDGRLQARIADPKHKMAKTYWVQVEGIPDEADLQRLRKGLMLKDGMTLPAKARLMEAPQIGPRDPPIRTRLTIPTSWIELSIKEGRNRQVRRMTAAIGFPTLRLIRHAIGNWSIDAIEPGHWIESSF